MLEQTPETTQTLISFHEAAMRGIVSINPVPEKKDDIDHIDIDIIAGAVGPWIRIYRKVESGKLMLDEQLLIDFLDSKESYFDDRCFVQYREGASK